MSDIYSYTPNRIVATDSNAVTTWFILASDGTGYASVAALLAAGKKSFPIVDPGTFIRTLKLRSKTTTDADGSSFEFALNKAAAPSVGEVVDAGPGLVLPGINLTNVWLKKSVATDIVEVTGAF